MNAVGQKQGLGIIRGIGIIAKGNIARPAPEVIERQSTGFNPKSLSMGKNDPQPTSKRNSISVDFFVKRFLALDKGKIRMAF